MSDEHPEREAEPARPAPVEEADDFDRAEDELVQLFLAPTDPRPAKIAFLVVAVVVIALLLFPFPTGRSTDIDERVIYLPEIEEFIPPVKEPEKVEIKEIKTVEKVALPDPTPDEPEPIIEPTPEPVPEPLPPNVTVRRGLPHGPPRKAGGPVREGTAGLTPPQLRKSPEPAYPEAARRIGFAGEVIVRAVIGTDGLVKSAEILKGLGRFGMDEAALEAAKKREYSPGILEGRPVEVITNIRIQFTLG